MKYSTKGIQAAISTINPLKRLLPIKNKLQLYKTLHGTNGDNDKLEKFKIYVRYFILNLNHWD